MKIEKLEIRNFGKMQNRTLEFSDGIQLISGENESGKSTSYRRAAHGSHTAATRSARDAKMRKHTCASIRKSWMRSSTKCAWLTA